MLLKNKKENTNKKIYKISMCQHTLVPTFITTVPNLIKIEEF